MTSALELWDGLDAGRPPEVAWARPAGDDRLALLLGAFDPITNAHLEILSAVERTRSMCVALCMTKVLLARSGDELFAQERRVEIVEAVAHRLEVGLAYANRGTYLDVGRALRTSGIDATFIVGSDKLAQLADPSFYADGRRGVDETFAESRFIVVPRAGAPIDRDDVDVLETTEVFDDRSTASLSATEVRLKITRGERVDHLVPPEVALALGGYTSAG